MTTSDGAKPVNGDKRKKKPAEPRLSERVYLLDLGTSLDDAETTRAKKGFSIPLKLGNDLDTPVGRECERTRKHFMPWLRQQQARGDEVGMLAEALCTHDASLEDGEEPARSWVQLLSRITRGRILHFLLGTGELRAAVEQAREEFNSTTLPHEREAKKPAEFAEAAE